MATRKEKPQKQIGSASKTPKTPTVKPVTAIEGEIDHGKGSSAQGQDGTEQESSTSSEEGTGQSGGVKEVVVQPDPALPDQATIQAIVEEVLDGTVKPTAPMQKVARSGDVMSPYAKRWTVLLRYTGNDPEATFNGPFPSGATYKVRGGKINAYGKDAQTLIDLGVFDEVMS